MLSFPCNTRQSGRSCVSGHICNLQAQASSKQQPSMLQLTGQRKQFFLKYWHPEA